MNNQILTSKINDSLFIKYSGSIQVPISLTLTNCLNGIIAKGDYKNCYFDLSEVDHLDSTALGLTARAGLKAQSITNNHPIIICNNSEIIKLLDSLGLLKQVFNIIRKTPCHVTGFQEEDLIFPDDEQARSLIIESHQLLIDLDFKNHDEFQCVIDSFQSDPSQKKSA